MRIGIIGAGQLGLMLGEAAKTLSVDCEFLDPNTESPAKRVGALFIADYNDATALRIFASRCDVITYEFENVPVDALRVVETDKPVFPSLDALAAAQDRYAEKRLFETLNIPLPAYQTIDSDADVDLALEGLGLPMIIKTRRFGYDGKGQVRAKTPDEAHAAAAELGGKALIAEAFVDFDYEVSAIATRARNGDVAYYGLTRNQHADGILDTSVAPHHSPSLNDAARRYIESILIHFDYVGTLTLELFVKGDTLLANEFAPRVHNSGHWTIEGTACSQFENHIRAVAGKDLGDPSPVGFSAMKNLIGRMPAGLEELEFAHLHDYGKSERPGRKLAHVTVNAATPELRDRALKQLDSLIKVS